MSCLKRGLKIAHAAQQQLNISRKTQDTTPVLLFLEILNKYLYYFDQGLPPITTEVLKARLPSSPPVIEKAMQAVMATRSTSSVSRGDSNSPSHSDAIGEGPGGKIDQQSTIGSMLTF